MKKLNRQEITAIAYRIQENINKARKASYKSVERLTVEAKLLPEYKELSKLTSNSAVRRALEITNGVKTLQDKRVNVIKNHIKEHGYTASRNYSTEGSYYTYYLNNTNLLDQIQRDITLEQLMSDDLQEMIDTITKRYING